MSASNRRLEAALLAHNLKFPKPFEVIFMNYCRDVDENVENNNNNSGTANLDNYKTLVCTLMQCRRNIGERCGPDIAYSTAKRLHTGGYILYINTIYMLYIHLIYTLYTLFRSEFP